jgi:hypothetical protein
MQSRECGRAGHAGGCNAIGRSCPKRVRRAQGARQIPRREPDQSPAHAGPIGCKARQVRLTHAGVGSLAVATPTSRRRTTSGVLPRKADREQLNDERGIKPLPVNDSRDASRVGEARPGWVRGRFCILPSEIVPRLRGGNYAGAGASDMPGECGRPCASSQRDCCREGQE